MQNAAAIIAMPALSMRRSSGHEIIAAFLDSPTILGCSWTVLRPIAFSTLHAMLVISIHSVLCSLNDIGRTTLF